ncbi:MAG: hypothetical protein WCA39_08670, partial [Nitrososphaeraceae archaeon]
MEERANSEFTSCIDLLHYSIFNTLLFIPKYRDQLYNEWDVTNVQRVSTWDNNNSYLKMIYLVLNNFNMIVRTHSVYHLNIA